MASRSFRSCWLLLMTLSLLTLWSRTICALSQWTSTSRAVTLLPSTRSVSLPACEPPNFIQLQWLYWDVHFLRSCFSTHIIVLHFSSICNLYCPECSETSGPTLSFLLFICWSNLWSSCCVAEICWAQAVVSGHCTDPKYPEFCMWTSYVCSVCRLVIACEVFGT